MHPGEQHIRAEMTAAISDHFNELKIHVEGVCYEVEIIDGFMAIVSDPLGSEIARYKMKVSAEKVGSPRVATPTPAPSQVPPAPPSGSTWINGTWGDVGSGYTVTDDTGRPWDVSRNGGEVTITSGTDSYSFSPDANQPVKYRTAESGSV